MKGKERAKAHHFQISGYLLRLRRIQGGPHAIVSKTSTVFRHDLKVRKVFDLVTHSCELLSPHYTGLRNASV